MDERAKILINEILQIKSQYAREVGPGGRKVWPRAIKDRICELSNLGMTIKSIAEMTGISAETLYVWRAVARKSGFKSLAVVNKKSAIATVTVATPNGFVIEGLPAGLTIDFLLKIGVR